MVYIHEISFGVASAEKRVYCSVSPTSVRRVLLSHFTDRETEAQRGDAVWNKATQVIVPSRAGAHSFPLHPVDFLCS